MRLDELANRMGDKITISWRAFLLRPENREITPETQAKFVAYTDSWQRPASVEPSVVFTPWSTEAPAPRSSVPAHVAARLIVETQPDISFAYHRALMKAYFTENRDISGPAVLAAVADACGGSGADLATALAEHGHRVKTEVRLEYATGVDQGITAAPTVVINNAMPVPGAQDVDAYEAWINRILARRG